MLTEWRTTKYLKWTITIPLELPKERRYVGRPRKQKHATRYTVCGKEEEKKTL